MKIGVLIYTYNRTDDARINMEIIRNLWNQSDLLRDVTIVHSFNGEKEWWPDKYLEDELLYLPNPGHFAGAEILLNEGMKCFTNKYPDVDYVITLASDTWLIKPEYVEKIIRNMKTEDKYLATCPWGAPDKDNMWNIGMALDFNILDLKWVIKSELFPIKFSEFVDKYSEIFMYKDENIFLESVFAMRFKQAVQRTVSIPSERLLRKISNTYVYRMKEREPVHDEKTFFGMKKGRKMYWPDLGILGHHEPEPKKAILKKFGLNLGTHSKRLVESTDLNYYNQGVKRTTFTKGNEKINYCE